MQFKPSLDEKRKIIYDRKEWIVIVVSFLLGLLGFLRINLVGDLIVSEIGLLIILPFVIHLFLSARPRYSGVFMFLFVLYLFSQVISDIYRDSAIIDAVRGWTRIGVTGTAFVVFSVFFSRAGNYAGFSFVIGSALAPLADLAIMGAQIDIYKFYVGAPVSIFAFILAGIYWSRIGVVMIAVPICAGVIAFVLNCRSLGGTTLLASALVFFYRWIENLKGQKFITKLIYIAIAVLLGASIVALYGKGAREGWLGTDVQERYYSQSKTSDAGIFEVLIGGRTEALFVWPKVMESPIIGWGSWAKDWYYVQGRAGEIENINLAAILGSRALVDEGLIPTHSHILGSWLEAGILGAIFWFAVLIATLNAFLSCRSVPTYMRWVYVFLLVTFVWDVWFSPYGGGRRLINGFMIAWILYATQRESYTQRKIAGGNGILRKL